MAYENNRPATRWALPAALALAWAMAILIPQAGVGVRLCLFFRMTGLACPFCGMTRAAAMAAHGNWGGAIAMSPLGAGLFAITLVVLAASVAALWSGKAAQWLYGTIPSAMSRHRMPVITAAAAAVAANWLYRLSAGLN
jgi:hypothetical protein